MDPSWPWWDCWIVQTRTLSRVVFGFAAGEDGDVDERLGGCGCGMADCARVTLIGEEAIARYAASLVPKIARIGRRFLEELRTSYFCAVRSPGLVGCESRGLTWRLRKVTTSPKF